MAELLSIWLRFFHYIFLIAYCFALVVDEGSHVVQSGLNLAMQTKTLNYWSPCLYLPKAEVSGVHRLAWCSHSNPGLMCARLKLNQPHCSSGPLCIIFIIQTLCTCHEFVERCRGTFLAWKTQGWAPWCSHPGTPWESVLLTEKSMGHSTVTPAKGI